MKAPEEYLSESRFEFLERWGKTEEDIKSDFEYGNGLNKLMSQEEMDKGIAVAALKAMQSDHDKESAKHHDLLIEILEYMEDREDADIEGANKEMRFAMGLREMLKID